MSESATTDWMSEWMEAGRELRQAELDNVAALHNCAVAATALRAAHAHVEKLTAAASRQEESP
jgi:hypothetical protein